MCLRVLLATAFLSSTILGFGQDNFCPEGFHHVGTLSGSGSYSEPFNEVVEMRLPMNATLDTSFQQTSFKATNRRGRARSPLTGKNIPAGIYVVAYGSEENNKGWAVTEPQLRIVQKADGTKDYMFGMRLYCDVTIGDSDMYGGCNVGVDLCYKSRPSSSSPSW